MYYEVLGRTEEGEWHNLGFNDDKQDAIKWAWFCMFNRGYEQCDIVDEDGVVVANYKRGV